MPVESVPIDRDTPCLLPPSLQDYVPAHHLARSMAALVDQLDMGKMLGVYGGQRQEALSPHGDASGLAMLLLCDGNFFQP